MMLSVAARKRRGDFCLDVAFELPTPGVLALFGRSGCGKSTLVNLIAGLLRPDAGRIRLNEVTLFDAERRIDVPTERRGLGYVFQDARLFPHLRVAGNLRYALERATGVHFVGLDAVIELLDLGALLQRRTHELSGGERQRVAIGRALLTQPRLLLLDEPLAALDAARRDEVLPYLETLRDRLALPMVYVTHRFDEVLHLATHLVLLGAGAVLAQGSLGAISLHPELRSIIGPDEVGAILDGRVLGPDPSGALTRVRVGRGELKLQSLRFAVGTALRVQLLARDIIVSTRAPQSLSVRNSLEGTLIKIDDDAGADLLTIDIGETAILARITKAATRDLGLAPGMPVWALVKSVSLRGHAFMSASRDA
jgi:molybdate transport system ATP-binding protein